MSALFVHLFNIAAYPKCFWAGQFNCTHNPLKDRPLVDTSSSHRSLTGELESGFQTSPMRPFDVGLRSSLSAGISLEVTAVIPGIGRGTLVFNAQFGGGVTGLYFYHPGDVEPTGFSLGGAIEGNIAYSRGGWKRDFDNYSLSRGALTGSYFQSPDGSWKGLSFGQSRGALLGAAYTRTYYRKLIPWR